MNDRRPLFTIAMPSYNAERFIADAVASIQAQTWQDWELIVVDDASTDATAETAMRAAAGDPRVRVVTRAVNGGVSQARNTGIEEARGLYVWLADADDTFDIDLLERVARILAENPAVVTLFGMAETYLDDEGNVKRVHESTFPETLCRTPEEVHAIALPLERSTLYGYANNKLYDVDYIRARGLRFEDERLSEDFFFNVKLIQHAPSLNVMAGAPYHYAKRASGTMTRAFVPEYYRLHRRRIQEMRDQLASWGMLDDEAKGVLGGLFVRYILSEIEHSYDPRSSYDAESRRAWLESVFADDLFCELVPYATGDDPLLRVCIVPFKRGNVSAALALGRAVHVVRDRAESVYRIAREGR